MNAMNRRFSSSEPAVAFSGVFNSCPICSKLPRYTRSNCGGYHLSCCGIRTKSCVANLTKENANALREEFNYIVRNSELSEAFVSKYRIENGDLVILKSEDDSIFASFDSIQDAIACMKQECKKNFATDFDLMQVIRMPNGSYRFEHIATSKILCFVGEWPGFRYDLMMPVE